jgi:hypothetical protein
MKTAPIKPCEVILHHSNIMPNFVIEAFNTMITQCWDGHASWISLSQIIEMICTLAILESPRTSKEAIKNAIIKNNWLNVIDTYKHAGWDVKYIDHDDERPRFVFNERVECNS